MSGFASELSASRRGAAPAAAATPTLPTQAVPMAEPAATPAPVDAVMNQGLPMPEHGSVHPEQAAKLDGSEVTPALRQEPSAATKIRIGDQFFDSVDDAARYAEELQSTLAQKDAYEQGRQSALPKAEPEPEVDDFAEFEQKLFEDPKATLRKVAEKAARDAEAAMEKRLQKQQEMQDQQRAEEQAWSDFSASNADLKDSRDLVQFVVGKNLAEISKLPIPQRAAYIADKTRALLGSRRESMLPSKELQNLPANVPGASSVATPAAPEKKSTAVDFISQVKKHGKRA